MCIRDRNMKENGHLAPEMFTVIAGGQEGYTMEEYDGKAQNFDVVAIGGNEDIGVTFIIKNPAGEYEIAKMKPEHEGAAGQLAEVFNRSDLLDAQKYSSEEYKPDKGGNIKDTPFTFDYELSERGIPLYSFKDSSGAFEVGDYLSKIDDPEKRASETARLEQAYGKPIALVMGEPMKFATRTQMFNTIYKYFEF